VIKEAARVCLYDERYADAYQKFCQTVWPRARTAMSRHEGIEESPSAGSSPNRHPAPIFLFLKDGEVVGHVASSPIHLWWGGKEIEAHWIVGFMVLPQYRNGLVGPLLIKEVNRVLDCALSLHVEPPVLRILRGFRWIHVGVLPQYCRVLNAREFVKNLQMGAVGVTKTRTNLWASILASLMGSTLCRVVGHVGVAIGQRLLAGAMFCVRERSEKVTVTEEQGFDSSFTDLWNRVKHQYRATVVRDQAHLGARFGRKMNRYRLLVCRQDGKLKGYCVLKLKRFSCDPRMGSMTIGTIVDCLYDLEAPAVLQAFLESAIDRFTQDGAHVAFCTASLPAIRRMLLRNAFVSIPGNLNFALHMRTLGQAGEIGLGSWHLMRGDSDTDQNF